MVVAEEDIALGMKELLMFALTVNTNLKLSTGILFCQGIINNKLANGLILVGKRFDIPLNIEIRELAHFLRGLIILKLRFLAYQ